VPADAPNPQDKPELTKAIKQKSVNMTRVIEWCKVIEARLVLFVFDSCISGFVFKSKTASVPQR
jgi:hypothetical protein